MLKTEPTKIQYYWYRFLWWIAPKLPRGKFIHLDLELNNNCNQKCISCWHSGTPKFKILQMDLVKAYRILRLAKEAGAKSVKFNLRGEPLIYNDMGEKLEAVVARANELGYTDIMINTNGVLLTKKRLYSLSQVGLTKAIISVDSFDERTYNKLHGTTGRSDFHTLMQNLRDIARSIKHKRKIAKVTLNVHINKINEHKVYPIKSIVKYLPITYRHTMNREGEKISTYRPGYRKKMCPHLSRRITVLADGSCYPCCLCYDEPDDIYLGHDFKGVMGMRQILMENYRRMDYTKSCKNCKSQDVYK